MKLVFTRFSVLAFMVLLSLVMDMGAFAAVGDEIDGVLNSLINKPTIDAESNPIEGTGKHEEAIDDFLGKKESGAVSSADPATQEKSERSKKVREGLENLLEEENYNTFNVKSFLQTEGGNESNLTINATNEENNILYKIIKFLISVVGTFAILLYIVGAFFIITHRGDSNQLQSGKRIIIYTSLGLAVAMLSYMIVQLVIGFVFDTAV